MAFIMLTWFLIRLSVGTSMEDGILVVSPKNVAVVAGQRMELECRTDNESIIRTWTFKNCSNLLLEFHLPDFRIDVDEYGSSIFYFNTTRIEDAGIYTCEADKGGKRAKHSAALVVFYSTPVCETNLTEHVMSVSYIWMHCTVQFRGDWYPIMEWRQHGAVASEAKPVKDEKKNFTSDNSDIIFTSSIFISSISINCSSFFSCKTYFAEHNGNLKINATNIPEFNYTWQSPIANVTCYSMLDSTTYADALSIGESVYIMFSVICASFFALTLVISIIGCIVVRRKTAESFVNFIAQKQANGKWNRETQRTVISGQVNNDSHDSLPREGGPFMELDIYQDETGLAASDPIVLASATMDNQPYCFIEDVLPHSMQSNNEPPEHNSIGIYAEATFAD